MKNNGGKINLVYTDSYKIKVNRKKSKTNIKSQPTSINPDYDQYYGLKLNKILDGLNNNKSQKIVNKNSYSNKTTTTENKINPKFNSSKNMTNKIQPNIHKTYNIKNVGPIKNNKNFQKKPDNEVKIYNLQAEINYRKNQNFKRIKKNLNKDYFFKNTTKVNNQYTTPTQDKQPSQNLVTNLNIAKMEMQYPLTYINHTSRTKYNKINATSKNVSAFNLNDNNKSNKTIKLEKFNKYNKNYDISPLDCSELNYNKDFIRLNKDNLTLSHKRNNNILVSPDFNETYHRSIVKVNNSISKSEKTTINSYKSCCDFYQDKKQYFNAKTYVRKKKNNYYDHFLSTKNNIENKSQNSFYESSFKDSRKGRKSLNGCVNCVNFDLINEQRYDYINQKRIINYQKQVIEEFCFYLEAFIFLKVKKNFDCFMNNFKKISEEIKKSLLLKRVYNKIQSKKSFQGKNSFSKGLDNYNETKLNTTFVEKSTKKKSDTYKNIFNEFAKTYCSAHEIKIRAANGKIKKSYDKYNTNYTENSIYIPKKSALCCLCKNDGKQFSNLFRFNNGYSKKINIKKYNKTLKRKLEDLNNKSQDMINMRRNSTKNDYEKNFKNYFEIEKLNQTNDDVNGKNTIINDFNLPKRVTKRIYKKKINNNNSKKKLRFYKSANKIIRGGVIKISNKKIISSTPQKICYNYKNIDSNIDINSNKNANNKTEFSEGSQLDKNNNTNQTKLHNTINTIEKKKLNINPEIKNKIKNTTQNNTKENNIINSKNKIENINNSNNNIFNHNSFGNIDGSEKYINKKKNPVVKELPTDKNKNMINDNNALKDGNDRSDVDNEVNKKEEIIVKDVSTKDKRINVFIKYIRAPKSKKLIKKINFFNNVFLEEINTDNMSFYPKIISKKNFCTKKNFYLNNYYSGIKNSNEKNDKIKLHKILASIIEEEEKSKATNSINNSKISDYDFTHYSFNNFFTQSIIYLTNYLQNILDDRKRDYTYNFIKLLKKKKNDSFLLNLISQKKLHDSNNIKKFKEDENGEVILFDTKGFEVYENSNNGFKECQDVNKILSYMSDDGCYYYSIKKSKNNFFYFDNFENKSEFYNLSYISINDNIDGDSLKFNNRIKLGNIYIKKKEKNLYKKFKLRKAVKNIEYINKLKFLGNYFFDWKKKTEDEIIKNDKNELNEEYNKMENILYSLRLKLIEFYLNEKK